MRVLILYLRKYFVFLFIMFLISSCFAKRKSVKEQRLIEEDKYVKNCREAWQYSDLRNEQCLEVVLFREASYISIVKRSSIFFCTNHFGDTLAVLDMDYKGDIKSGTKVVFEPYAWSDNQKKYIQPPYFYSIHRDFNEIFCAVTNVYYGKVKEVLKP